MLPTAKLTGVAVVHIGMDHGNALLYVSYAQNMRTNRGLCALCTNHGSYSHSGFHEPRELQIMVYALVLVS